MSINAHRRFKNFRLPSPGFRFRPPYVSLGLELVTTMVSFRAVLSSTSIFLALFTHPALADSPINPSFAYGSSKVRGVNLGGWLVLEVSVYRP